MRIMIEIASTFVFFLGAEMKLSPAEKTALICLRSNAIFQWPNQTTWKTRFKSKFKNATIWQLEQKGLVRKFTKETPNSKISFNRQEVTLTDSGLDLVDTELIN